MIRTGKGGRPLAVALAFLMACALCRAGEGPPRPGGERPRAEQLAGEASAAEMAARFTEAANLYLQAAAESAESAGRAADGDDAGRAEAAWAEAEFLTEKACALAEKTSRRAALLPGLGRLAKAARPRPLLANLVAWRTGQALRAAGDEKAAAREFASLGFITDWQVIGPFDNERGQGFARTYPPEKGVKLTAEYRGKKRAVSWRRTPVRAADGLVDLAGMLRPEREAVAYLATWVSVEGREDLPVAVRLGSADGVRVWLNGKAVFERDAHRPPGFDQDSFGAVLRPGWNSLLVKVAQSDGEWGLRLRLTGPAGGPLAGVRVRADAVRAAAEPWAGREPEIRLGAADFLERRLGANHKDADALMRSGFLAARRRAFDREGGARPDRDLLRRAAEARPADARLWYELSFVSAVGGRMSAETDENPRREALEKSLKLNPSAAAELELAAYYLRRYRNFGKCARRLDRARAVSPDSAEVRLLEIEMAEGRGDLAEAVAAAERLVKSDAKSARAAALLARLTAALGNPAGAAEHYAAAIRNDAGDDLTRESLDSLVESGQPYRAIDLLGALLARHPCRAELRLERARLMAARGDYDGALAECRRGLSAAPEDHRLLARTGDYLEWLGKGEEARRARRRALELMPNYVALERYVDYLEGRAGYDRRHREKSSELLAAGERLQPGGEHHGAYLLNKVIDRVHPDGTGSRTVHWMVKILSERGARRFSSQTVVYYAGEQRAAVRTARVFRAGGGTENARVLPERTYSRAERELGARLVHFPSPAVGDVVELEYRVDDLEQGFFGRYFGSTFLFRREMPVLRARYVLIVPKDLEVHFRPLRCDVKPEERRDAGDGTVAYTWTVADQPAIVREPMMPPPEELSPGATVSTYKDWDSFGRWYWGLIRKQLEPGPQVRAKARELAAGAADKAGIIRAIYNFVVKDIRYEAWEFGVHGFKPYRAEQVLARRFGDCKDKAALICAMLAEHGITAEPVLIRAQPRRARQDLALPLISHFNHCIVRVPAAAGRREMWLDGTATESSIDALPDADRGARVAVITPKGALVSDVPASAPEMNTTTDRFVLTLLPDGSGRGEVRASATGNRSAVMRRHFRNPLHRSRILDRLHGRRSAGAATGAIGFSDLDDLNRPVSYKYTLAIPKLLRKSEGMLELEMPDDPLRGVLGHGGSDDLFAARFSSYTSGAARRHDLVLPAAWRHTARYEITLPPGWRPADLPEDVRLQTDFGSLIITRKFAAGKLVVDKTVSLAATRVPAARYPEFRKFCLRRDRLEARRIQLARPAGPAEKPPSGADDGGQK
ncbi:MAG: DUF3857 domain-containing protein [Planctomycetota bacterium]|jgi:tetratricopeptide (TPR) repeat protein/transglutaminase-like putative cysteine protease